MAQVQDPIVEPSPRRTTLSEESVSAPVADRDWTWLIFAAITGLALVLRLWDLGDRAMHHDESLHALYSWYLYVGKPYMHDPMMHGPFLFHITALIYALFGDSEVTARLPIVLLGSAAVFLPYFLRHEVGRYGAIAASVMLAFGPVFLYMSRFGHNEGMLVFQTLLTVVGVFGWIRTRRSVYLYAAAVGIAMLFATKVVVYIVGFIIVTFVAAVWVVGRIRPIETDVGEIVADIGWRRALACLAIFFGVGITLYTTFFTNLEGLCTAVISPPVGTCAGKQGMLQYWFAQQEVRRGGQPVFYYFMLLPLYEIVPTVLAMASPFLVRRRTLFFWFCAWWLVFTLFIYSYAGEKMPWLTVHPALPLVFMAALGIDGPLRSLRWPWGINPRQWAVVGLLLLAISSYVAWAAIGGESATQIAGVTVSLRRLALAAVVIAVVFGLVRLATSLSRGQVVGSLSVGLMIILLGYSVRTAWQVTYKNGDIPVEMLVYVQSSPDVPYIVNDIERISNALGLRKDMPLLLDGGYTEVVNGQKVDHEAVSWPFEWYFRDYKAKTYFQKNLPADFSTGRYPLIVVMGTSLDPIRDQLGGYTGNKYRLNWWYPEDYKNLTRDTLIPTLLSLGEPEVRTKLFKYVVYRELVNPPLGTRELYYYVRNDLIGGGGAPGQQVAAAPGGAPAVAPVAVDSGMQVVSSFGRVGTQNLLSEPKGIAVAPDGRVYVVDEKAAKVTVFSADGALINSWGSRGKGDGEFTDPWGIALGPDGSVYVADTWNHRIQKFDAQGRFLIKWGSGEIGTEPGRFYGPRDIAVSPSGEVLVTDTGNKRIQVFDQNGTLVRTFGSEGSNPGQFREPVGLAVDRSGRIYVADTWNQRIQVFDSNFQAVAQYPVTGWSNQSQSNKPYLAVSPSGEVYATLPDRQALVRVSDGVVTTLALPGNPRPGMPIGIDIDASGRIYVSDTRGSAVISYAPAGAE